MADSNDSEPRNKAVSPEGLLIGDDGSVRFTQRRKEELRRYFAMAGINIDSIKTKADYLEARAAASPYFDEWIQSIVTSKPMTTERRLVLATLQGDDSEVARLKIRLETERLKQETGPHREA